MTWAMRKALAAGLSLAGWIKVGRAWLPPSPVQLAGPLSFDAAIALQRKIVAGRPKPAPAPVLLPDRRARC